MSITDELRRYAANWDGWFYSDKDGGLINAIGHVPAQSTPVPKVINAIADRIDEQHRKALERVAAMVDEPDELDRLDKRIKALEHLTDGMLLAESEMEGRISAIERKLNHRGER